MPRVRLRRTCPRRHWQQAASGTLGAESLLGIGIPYLRTHGAETALISYLDPKPPRSVFRLGPLFLNTQTKPSIIVDVIATAVGIKVMA